ncbi:MAG: PfkB family carbohydrate kinase [Terriglobia bacterium]
MNFWISSKLAELKMTLAEVDILIINDGEARMLANQSNLTKAARTISSWGPKIVVVKKGEHGVAMFSDHSIFGAPAFPLEDVFDPHWQGIPLPAGL